MDIRKALKDYGLNDNEVGLFLASLKLGETSIAHIAEEAGIKRSTAYSVAKSLETKGLMGSFRMRSGMRFVASPPSALIKQLHRHIDDISAILPELNALSAETKTKPQITLYEGKEGYFTVAEDSLSVPNEIIYHIGSLQKAHDVIGEDYDFKYYVPTRVKNHIKFKALYFAEEIQGITKEQDVKELREIRLLPQKYFHPTSMLIYRDNVVIFTSKKELVAIKIRSKEIAEAEKQKFKMIWDLSDQK